MARYQVITLDVIGNEEDGFDVNDCWPSGRYVDIEEDADASAVLASLLKAGEINTTEGGDVDMDDDRLIVQEESTGRPVLFLDREE